MSASVDWNRAEQIALRIAARHAAPTVGAISSDEFVERARIGEERIEATTGLRSRLGPAHVRVIDRAEWIRANIASFRNLLEPVMTRWTETSAARRTLAVTRQIAAAEIGLMLCWMSGRVLGQYDLLVGDVDEDAVYLVGPNMLGLEHRFGFPADDFRMWVALHELTHRAQFTGVPWMRQHFLDLVHETLELAEPDPTRFLAAARDAMRDRDSARQRLRDGGITAVVATPEQQQAFGRVGGLMSLLEGHGDVVMDRASVDLVSGADRFGRVLRERRRCMNPWARMMQRLVGLEGKLNQYAPSERFIAEIEKVAGRNVVNKCWELADNLPTLDEIRAPELWLERLHVEQQVA